MACSRMPIPLVHYQRRLAVTLDDAMSRRLKGGGELLDTDSCIFRVRIRNIRHGKRAAGVRGVPYVRRHVTYKSLDMEVLIRIRVEPDRLREKLHGTVLEQLQPLKALDDKQP